MVQFFAIALLVSSLAAFGGGWKLHEWSVAKEEAARLEAEAEARQIAQMEVNRMGEAFLAEMRKYRAQQKIFYNTEVRNELTTKTVYTNPDCNLPESGRVLLNKNIDAANSAATGDNANLSTDPKTGEKSNSFWGSLLGPSKSGK